LRKSKHIFHNVKLHFESRAFYEIIWKNNVVCGQATDENMAHAHCMLHT